MPQGHIAKNIVGAGIAKKCEVQLAYAIGVANPVSIMVDTFETSKINDDELAKVVEQVFDLRPSAIIESLNLKKTIYKNLASYGHMGREDLDVAWENLNKVNELKQLLKL